MFDFHEILECRFEKTQQDRANRKREMEIGSPDYMKKLQEVFSKCQEFIQSGKVNEMDISPFQGNPETGKAIFETIANSLSEEEKENFHFWPQMTEQEKTDHDNKDQEPDNQTDPFLQNCRTSVISEINNFLKESKLTNNDLEPSLKNWESQINHTEDVLEIFNIQKLVLSDIKKKKTNFLHQIEKKMWAIGGSIILVLGLLIISFILMKKLQKPKRAVTKK
ncbi:MAG: hypothetical protein MRERC_4c121 [Mycoplasmataceae bacterium RC_NB112A]|nr:MAG: hypothetical protein MRERC_6c061 [Mycoplasmataceae bacterium RC_NB112A]KLL02155.1 MAG: hypothetical protein MRERC_4c121 [Mycoplasmataceae bacterium RC_NB112A]